MISITDVVTIRNSPETIYTWFEGLEDNYRDWHPDHIRCRCLTGIALAKGTVYRMDDMDEGDRMSFRLTITDSQKNKYWKYKSGILIKGWFTISEHCEVSEVEAGVSLGWNIGGWIGRQIDHVLGYFMNEQLSKIQKHMVEEGSNMKRIMERSSTESFTLPVSQS